MAKDLLARFLESKGSLADIFFSPAPELRSLGPLLQRARDLLDRSLKSPDSIGPREWAVVNAVFQDLRTTELKILWLVLWSGVEAVFKNEGTAHSIAGILPTLIHDKSPPAVALLGRIALVKIRAYHGDGELEFLAEPLIDVLGKAGTDFPRAALVLQTFSQLLSSSGFLSWAFARSPALREQVLSALGAERLTVLELQNACSSGNRQAIEKLLERLRPCSPGPYDALLNSSTHLLKAFEAILLGVEPDLSAFSPWTRLSLHLTSLLSRGQCWKALRTLDTSPHRLSPAVERRLMMSILLGLGAKDKAALLLHRHSMRIPPHSFLRVHLALALGRRREAGEHYLLGIKKLEMTGADSSLDMVKASSPGITPADWAFLELVRSRPALLDQLPPDPGSPASTPEPEVKHPLVGSSAPLRDLRRQIRRLGSHSMPVLVTGEHGTGKSLVARLLHVEGPRSQEPFVIIHGPSLMESIMESELFGHVKGAYSGAAKDRVGLIESARGGTVYLDNLQDWPLTLQAKLLRVLEEGRVLPVGATEARSIRARFIASSTRPLKDLVREGLFRADLMYRLGSATLELPPLHLRKKDIPHLMRHFASQHGRVSISRELERAWSSLDWPGQVRELEHAVEHMVLHHPDTRELRPGDSPPDILLRLGLAAPADPPESLDKPLSPVARRRLIAELIGRWAPVTPRELMAHLEISRPSLTLDLRALVSSGTIRRLPHSHAYVPL